MAIPSGEISGDGCSSQEGPDAWGINADAFLTTAVTNNGKVTATFAWLSVN